jgi:transmembrane sensor
MLQQSDIEKLDRFSRGLSDPEEELYIYSLYSDLEESRSLEEHLHSGWIEYLKDHPARPEELTWLLDRIHHIIHNRERRKEQTMIRKLYRWYSLAAAILLIPFLIAAGFWLAGREGDQKMLSEQRMTSNLVAPMGSRIAFTLPDGTKGWLNSGSAMAYSLPFSDQRKVTLIGEAWFEVARDEKNPFEITAGNSKIRVLGTKFNVNAYPAEKYVEVVLDEGKVEFSCPGISVPVVLKPDERLVYRNEKVNLSMTDASKYAAWVDGKLVFRGDPMAEVARRLERWYNIDVEIVDKDLETYTFRGTFQDDSLAEVLRLLSMTSPIRYKISERKALDDGTFEKEKVLLYRKNIRKN